MPRGLFQLSHDNQPFQMNNPNNTDSTVAERSRSTAFADASLGVKRLAIFLAFPVSIVSAKAANHPEPLFVGPPIVWIAVRGIDWVIRGFLYEKK